MLTHTVGAGARGRVPVLLALTLVTALAACGTDPASPRPLTGSDVAGIYVLTTVDDHPLPARDGPKSGTVLMFDTVTVQDGGTALDAGAKSNLNDPGVIAYQSVDGYRWAFDASASRLLLIHPGMPQIRRVTPWVDGARR